MIYSATQIVGKDLFAKKTVLVYALPDQNSNVVRTVYSGGRIGNCTSYIQRGSLLFWQIGWNDYILHDSSAIDLEALKEQGALSVTEQEAEEKSFFDDLTKGFASSFSEALNGLFASLNPAITTIALLLVAAIITITLIQKFTK